VAAEWPALDALALEQDDVPLADLIYRWARSDRLTGSDDDRRARRKLFDLRLKIAGQIAVLRQDAILQRLALALDLAPNLRGAGRAADMLNTLFLEPWPDRLPRSGNRYRRAVAVGNEPYVRPQPEAVSAASSVSLASLAAMPGAELMP
jgi:hypothetical protein